MTVFRPLAGAALWIAASVVLGGCATGGPRVPADAPAPAAAAPVPATPTDTAAPPHRVRAPTISDIHTAISAEGQEPQGFGVYTYVLFGRLIDADSSALTPAVRQRYANLLAAISASSEQLQPGASAAKRSSANLFCVPWASQGLLPLKPPLSGYNSALAFRLLDRARDLYAGRMEIVARLRENPGPFLVSTIVPLSDPSVPPPILFADVSNINPGAIDQLVAEYKSKLGTNFSGIQEFESLKITILNGILNASDAIDIIAPAIAKALDKGDPTH